MQFPLSPIFNVTLRAAASWVFFRVAGSTRVNPDMGASEARKNVGFSDLGRRSPTRARRFETTLYSKRLFWTAAALQMYAERRLGQSQYREQLIATACLVSR
jgi:hypothetical protein